MLMLVPWDPRTGTETCFGNWGGICTMPVAVDMLVKLYRVCVCEESREKSDPGAVEGWSSSGEKILNSRHGITWRRLRVWAFWALVRYSGTVA